MIRIKLSRPLFPEFTFLYLLLLLQTVYWRLSKKQTLFAIRDQNNVFSFKDRSKNLLLADEFDYFFYNHFNFKAGFGYAYIEQR